MGGGGNSSRTAGTGGGMSGESVGKGSTPQASTASNKNLTEKQKGLLAEAKADKTKEAKKPKMKVGELRREQLEKERASRAELKGMSPKQRIEHFAKAKMLDRHLKKEFGKWQKAGGDSYKEWSKKLEEIKKDWKKGGAKRWEKANKKQAKSIRDKTAREEKWRNMRKDSKKGKKEAEPKTPKAVKEGTPKMKGGSILNILGGSKIEEK